jgi:hypothetical protein
VPHVINGGIRKGKYGLALIMRMALLAAIKDVEKAKGKSLPELRADGRVTDPLALWYTIRQCLPRKDTRLYSA